MTRTTPPRPAIRRRAVRNHLTTALACLLALGMPISTTAQGSPVQESAQELLTVVGGWEKSQNLASSAAVEGLAVKPRTDLLHRGAPRLRFQDFEGRVLEAELDRTEQPMVGATTWIGRVAEFGEHSQVLLTAYEGMMAGYFDTPEGRYEIAPRPGGHVLVKLDAARFAGCDTGHDEEHDHPVSDATFERAARNLGVDPLAIRQQAGQAVAQKSTAQIEIAVLTTQTATNAAGGPVGALLTGLSSIAVLNNALRPVASQRSESTRAG